MWKHTLTLQMTLHPIRRVSCNYNLHQNWTSMKAVDFGTTYTTIGYVKRGEPKDSILNIDNFPEDR
jgi:hypothetical protein